MEKVIDQTARCRKTFKTAGVRVDERCAKLDEHAESTDSAHLAGIVAETVAACVKCQRKGLWERREDAHHAVHIARKTKRALEDRLAFFRAETESNERAAKKPAVQIPETADESDMEPVAA